MLRNALKIILLVLFLTSLIYIFIYNKKNSHGINNRNRLNNQNTLEQKTLAQVSADPTVKKDTEISLKEFNSNSSSVGKKKYELEVNK